jgi:MFS family permease
MPAVFRAFESRNYALYWTGALLSNVGSWMQNLALGWLVLQLTNSAFWVGFVSFAGLFPSLFLSLFGGVLADRMDRRLVLMATQTAMMVIAAILATLTALHLITVPLIVLLSLSSGFAAALNTPAPQAIVSDLVPADVLLNAISLNSVQFNLARVIGPACAGAVLAWLNVAACFYLNALSFVALIAALVVIRTGPRRSLSAQSVWRHLGEGFAYVQTQPLLRMTLTVSTILSLFCLPYAVLLPVFARDILHVGAAGLGYLTASAGSGAVLGGLGLAALGNVRNKARWALRAGMLFSAAVVTFAVSRNLYLSVAMLVLAGGSMVACLASLNTLLQLSVDPAMRGRVLSMYLLTVVGLGPIGSLQVGTLAHFIGTPLAVALGGGVSFVFLTAAVLRFQEGRPPASPRST